MKKFLNYLKIFWEKDKFKHLGKGVYIHYSARFSGKGSISLGDEVIISRGVSLSGDVKIGDRTWIGDFVIIQSWGGKIELGADCSVNPFCVLYGHGGLKIGNGVRIATQVVIAPMNHIFKEKHIPIYKQGIEARGIIIEDDIWIGANAIILDGVKIGKGSVIGAGSVVTEDVEPYSIVVGVPARIIRKR